MSSDSKNSKKFRPGEHLRFPPLAFIICLAISVLLWLFMKLSREYTISYDYAVSCIDVPKGHDVQQLSDNTLTLTFKGKGFAFLHPQFLKKNRNIELSINRLLKEKGDFETTQFTQNELSDYIRETQDLGSEFVGVTQPNVLFVYTK